MKFSHQIHYRLHSWSGAVLGIMLYMLCFSGTVAVYKDELVRWCNPPARAAESATPLSLNQLYVALSDHLPEGDQPRRLTFPAGAYGVYELRSLEGFRVVADRSGNIVPERSTGLADFLVNLHTRIFFGHEGRWLIGVAAFGFLASLVTGLMAHRKLLSNPLGNHTTVRQKVVSWHKVIGVFGLPGYFVFAVTGLWLGLYGLIIPAADYMLDRFGTDKDQVAIRYEVSSPEDQSIDSLLAHTAGLIDGFEPVFIDWPPQKGGKTPTVDVRGNLAGSLIQRHRVGATYNRETGEAIDVHAPGYLTWQQRLHDSMMPLHFGDWGGQLVKLLYFVLGAATTILCFTGLWVWADRRTRQAGWIGGPSNWTWHWVIGIAGVGSVLILMMPLLARWGMTDNFETRFLQFWLVGVVAYLSAAYLREWFTKVSVAEAPNVNRQSLKKIPRGTWVFLFHGLAVIALGYAQYLTSREAKDMTMQGLASWHILVGLACVAATWVNCFYHRMGWAARVVATCGLIIVAADSLGGVLSLVSLVAIMSWVWYGDTMSVDKDASRVLQHVGGQ